MSQVSTALESPPSLAMDRGTTLIVAGLAAVAFLAHFRIAPGFGWFRDEMYFLACADHLAWGYTDHPFGTVLIAWVMRKLFGESFLALRIFPALGHAGIIVSTAVLTRALGGKRYAVALACLGVLVAPIHMILGGILNTNFLESCAWTVMVTLAVLILQGGSEKLWLWFGLVGGIALEFKVSLAGLAFCLVVGMLLTGHGHHLRRKWMWLGGGIAMLLILPYGLWNAQHGWITIETLRGSNSAARTALGLVDFSVYQIILQNPITLVLWFGGLAWLLGNRQGRPFRAVGAGFLVYYILMMALHAKAYYLAACFVPLMAAGAVAREQHFEAHPKQAWLKPGVFVVFAICGVLVAPLTMPLLSPPETIAYAAPVRDKIFEAPNVPKSALWPVLSEETGWPERVEKVAEAWRTLTPEEQRRAAIFTTDFGEASAVNLFGPRYRLPHAVSGNQSYWVWGPEGNAAQTDVLILVGERRYLVGRECASLTTGAVTENPYGRAFENGPILVCRGLKRPLRDMWPELKYWGQD